MEGADPDSEALLWKLHRELNGLRRPSRRTPSQQQQPPLGGGGAGGSLDNKAGKRSSRPKRTGSPDGDSRKRRSSTPDDDHHTSHPHRAVAGRRDASQGEFVAVDTINRLLGLLVSRKLCVRCRGWEGR